MYGRPDVIAAAKGLVSGRNGRLDIVIQEPAAEFDDLTLAANPFVQCLAGQETFHVSRGAEEVVEMPSHFMVVDGTGYRFEPDKSQQEAYASFNDPQTASKLHALFLNIVERSTKIELKSQEQKNSAVISNK